MDSEKWRYLLQTLTGDYGREFICPPVDNNHIHLTLEFFFKQGIDSPEKSFLDLGCGTLAPLRQLTQAQWQGFDIMPSDVATYVVGDAHELPYAAESIDIIFCSHVLEHVLSPLLVLSEMRRVLKDNGDVIIGVPIDPGFMTDDHNYVLTMKGWELLCNRAGFIVKARDQTGDAGCLHLRKRNL